jgi:hypothetical protein
VVSEESLRFDNGASIGDDESPTEHQRNSFILGRSEGLKFHEAWKKSPPLQVDARWWWRGKINGDREKPIGAGRGYCDRRGMSLDDVISGMSKFNNR